MREIIFILHLIGLVMGLGVSFSSMFLGIATAKMEKKEAEQFMLKVMAPLSRMGHIGLGLLIVTGLILIQPYWRALGSMPLLIAKLVLVGVLSALIGIISANARKARKGEATKYLNKISILGRFSLLTGLAIVVLAVYALS